MNKAKLPIFLDEVNKIGKNKYLTKRQIQDYILTNYSELAKDYCIHRSYNKDTGLIERKYAWHSIIDELNKNGGSTKLIKDLLWT